MKKPSDQMRIDETNDLLGSVPGLGFAPPVNRQRVTGGKGPKIDTQMQVEDTNKLVESITGGGLQKLNEHGPSPHRGHLPLHEDVFSDAGDVAQHIDETIALLSDMTSELHSYVQNQHDDPMADEPSRHPNTRPGQYSAADYKKDLEVLRAMLKMAKDMKAKSNSLKTV